MQRPPWDSPARWWLIAVAVGIGIGAAVAGLWWTTVGMAVLVIGHLVGIVHRRRREVRRDSSAGP